jgi:hypothetical protein
MDGWKLERKWIPLLAENLRRVISFVGYSYYSFRIWISGQQPSDPLGLEINWIHIRKFRFTTVLDLSTGS